MHLNAPKQRPPEKFLSKPKTKSRSINDTAAFALFYVEKSGRKSNQKND